MRILNEEVELVDVESLEVHPDNPRQGDVDFIEASISAHGFFGAVVAQKSTRRVVAGNHRLIAAKRAGAEKLPVVWVDISDEHALRILLADNRASDKAGYDPVGLAKVLEELMDTEDMLAGTGYSSKDFSNAQHEMQGDGGDWQGPLDDQYEAQFGVIVVCEGEAHQQEVYSKLLADGNQCRVVVV